MGLKRKDVIKMNQFHYKLNETIMFEHNFKNKECSFYYNGRKISILPLILMSSNWKATITYVRDWIVYSFIASPHSPTNNPRHRPPPSPNTSIFIRLDTTIKI